MKNTWRVLSLILCTAMASCVSSSGELTQIVVVTSTDFALGMDLARVVFDVQSNARIDPIEVEVSAETEFPLTLTLVPSTDANAPLSVLVTGFDASGAELVSQQRNTSFVAGTSSALHFYLSRVCVQVECAIDEICTPSLNTPECDSRDLPGESLPPFVDSRSSGGRELCNGRDDDGDLEVDNGFDLNSDPLHCMECFNRCEAPANSVPVCRDGECDFECTALFGDCDGDPSNGCETETVTADRCGSCTTQCSGETPFCDGEMGCVNSCAPPEQPCGDDGMTCVDTLTDVNNCGGCGIACDVNPGLGRAVCVMGECDVVCDPGAHPCGLTCRSDTDPDFCTADCIQCPERMLSDNTAVDAACDAQGCTYNCVEPRLDCERSLVPEAMVCETNGGADRDNCGGCGVICGFGRCRLGECLDAGVTGFGTGPRHACATLANGETYCWGANEFRQASANSEEEQLSLPTLVSFRGQDNPDIGTFVLSLEDQTSYFARLVSIPGAPIVPQASVVPFGRNPLDPMGATLDSTNSPMPMIGPMGELIFDQIGSPPFTFAAGNGARFVVYGEGVGVDRMVTLEGVGAPGFSAFSPFTDLERDPTMVRTVLSRQLRGDVAIFPGSLARGARATCTHILSPDADGSFPYLECWGTGTAELPTYVGRTVDGRMGFEGSAEPVRINPSGTSFDARNGVSLGYNTGCASFAALDEAARYHCWGEWQCGIHGDPASPVVDATLVNTTLRSSDLPNVSVGRGSACAAKDGRLLCWGDDLLGGCNAEPTHMFPEYTDIESVSLGDGYGCFLREGGALYCWGTNAHGRLGSGGAIDETPVQPTQVVFRMP